MTLKNEPFHIYRAAAASNLSSHSLADFRKSPLLYRKKQMGLILDEDRPAYVIGRATHTYILEGVDTFDAEYAVGGPINPRTGKSFGVDTKAFDEWAQEIGKPVITEEQLSLVKSMQHGVALNKTASNILESGNAEQVARCKYSGIDCQSRFDWNTKDDIIADLKTCDDLDYFEYDAKRFGYIYQMAFYQQMYKISEGNIPEIYFIAIEKKEPYRCGVWLINQQTLNIATQENESAMQRLLKAKESDTWSTGYEELRTFDSI
jgi:hypothetical protein